MTEFYPFILNRSGVTPDEFIRLLRNNHFRIFKIDKKKKEILPLDLNDLMKKYTIKKENHTNLLCIKGNNEFFSK